MECVVCRQLITEFAEATTSYSIAVARMPQGSRINRKQSFFEAHGIARQEFEKCSRAHDALERHRSTIHLNRNNALAGSRQDWSGSIPSEI